MDPEYKLDSPKLDPQTRSIMMQTDATSPTPAPHTICWQRFTVSSCPAVPRLITLLVAMLTAIALTGCGEGDEPIRTATAPSSELPSLQPTQQSVEPDAPQLVIDWALPETWRQLPAQPPRLATVKIPTLDDGEELELSVVAFPGYSGTMQADIARWTRQQFPGSEADVEVDVRNLSLTAGNGQMVDLLGPAYNDQGHRNRLITIRVDNSGVTWFVKVTGRSDRIESIYDPLITLIKNTGFNQTRSGEDTGNIEARWTAPEAWPRRDQAPAPALAIYDVPGGEAGDARLAISAIPGGFSNPLLNMNRWRQQVGLPPVQDAVGAWSRDDRVPSDTGTRHILIFESPADAAEPKTLLVFLNTLDHTTWFVTMLGPTETVETNLDAYKDFVASLQFTQVTDQADPASTE